MSFYSYEKLGEYSYEITRIENLEDAPDVVYTHEEMKEILGDNFSGYGKLHILKHKIVAALNDLKQDMLANNKKSCKITDAALVEVLKSQTTSDFVKGLRRVGNRLSLHDNSSAEEKKRNKQLFGALIYQALHVFYKKTKIDVNMSYADQDRKAALNVVKSMATIDEVIEYAQTVQYHNWTDEECAIARQMWDNLDDFFEVVTEEVPEQTA